MISFKLAIVFVSCVGLVSAHVEYGEEYDQIDAYLFKNVGDSKDVQEYMNKAVEWLSSMGIFSQIKDRLRKGPDAKIAPALRQLVALKDLEECTYKEYDILRRNDLATGGLGRDQGATRPVDQVVYKYSLDHAVACQLAYPLEYKHQLTQLDSDLARRVESFHKFYLKHVRYASNFQNEWLANNETDVYEFLTGLNDPQIYKDILNASIEPLDASKAIVSLAKEFPKGSTLNSVLSLDFQSAEFYSYLLKPCDHYVNRMDFFYAAQYDNDLLKVSKQNKPEIHTELSDYYFGWSKFNLCRQVLDHQAEYKKFWLENWDTVAVKGEKPVIAVELDEVDHESEIVE